MKIIKLRIIRTDKGLAAKTVAKYIGVDLSTYYGWERGKSRPISGNTVKKLLDLFGATYSELFQWVAITGAIGISSKNGQSTP